jgi:hypothetical protein
VRKKIETPITKKEGVIVITTRDGQTVITNVLLGGLVTMYGIANGVSKVTMVQAFVVFTIISIMTYFIPEFEYYFRKMIGKPKSEDV